MYFLFCILDLSKMTNTIQKKFEVSSTQLLYQSSPYQAGILLVSGPFLDGLLTNQNVFTFNYTPQILVSAIVQNILFNYLYKTTF